MGQSRHTQLAKKFAGPGGQTEAKLPSGRRLDVMKADGTATEVERAGTKERLRIAIERLVESQRKTKELRVPQKDVAKAAKLMAESKVAGEVGNLSGTRGRKVEVIHHLLSPTEVRVTPIVDPSHFTPVKPLRGKG